MPPPASAPTATTSGTDGDPLPAEPLPAEPLPAIPVSGDRARRFRRRVLDWGAGQRRDLPWRRTRDPWHILVSEVMLQQTQVDRPRPPELAE